MLASLLSLIGLPSILTFLTPFLSSFLGFVGWYFKELWDGLKVVAANLSVIVVIVTVAVLTAVYSAKAVDCPPPKVITKQTPSTSWNPFDVFK